MTIRVRRLEPHDLPTRVAWLNAPAIHAYMTLNVPMSLGETQQWYQRAASNELRRDFVFAEVASGQEKRLVSMGGLVDIDLRHSRAELYMMVHPERQGRGIGRLTVRWLCNFGFNSLRLNRIYLTTLAHNERARRLYERHGFVFEGRLRRHLLHGGQYVDRMVHGLLRDEWLHQPWAIVDSPVPLEVTVS